MTHVHESKRSNAARISETAAVVARTDRRMVDFVIMSFSFSRREAHLLPLAYHGP